MMALAILPILLIFVGVVGAVILRAAISIANKIVRSRVDPNNVNAFDESPDVLPAQTVDPTNPYSAPVHAATGGTRDPLAIPEPSFPYAILIAVIMGFVGGLFNGLIGAATSGSPALSVVGSILSLAVNFVVGSFIISKMLPTSFGRAALVYLFYGLIALAIAIVIGLLAFIVMRVA